MWCKVCSQGVYSLVPNNRAAHFIDFWLFFLPTRLIRNCTFILFVCFDLGFHTRNPVIKYRPDASCMSHMEARAEMPWENNSQSPIPWAQRVADRVHLRLAFLPGLEPATRRSADRRVTDRATREGKVSKQNMIQIKRWFIFVWTILSISE